MIEKCYYIKSSSINPYYNLALEDYLFHNIPANSLVFFLCQNQNTVMIGKNQNAYKECHLQAMEEDHCYLARRSSGGGAVFQDMGNLNYSFMMYMDSYDIEKQTQTIVNALKSLGVPAVISGRNDIEADGYKVSGNAYLTEKEHCLHHGTVMLNVDKEKMFRYLNVSDKKIQAKGFDSVVSRVANITEFNPTITLNQLQQALLQAVANTYGPLYELNISGSLDEIIEHYHSYKYIYNTMGRFTVIVHDYYSFGELQMYVDIENGTIQHMDMFTDAMDVEIEDKLHKLFDNMHIDDNSFKTRLFTLFDRDMHADMGKIYLAINRYMAY